MITQQQSKILENRLQDVSSVFGNNIIFSEAISSTQDALVGVADSVPDGTVWLTSQQYAGHGRQGRHWASPPGSLTFSILLRPDIPPSHANVLMLASAISLHDTLHRYVPHLSIKWPNDIVINGKVAGTIIDTAVSNTIHWAVIGIGINVNVDTKNIPGTKYETDSISNHIPNASGYDILEGFLNRMNQLYTDINRHETGHIQKLYAKKCSTIGNVIHHNNTSGKAVGIDTDGALMVQTDTGIKRIIISH